MMIMLTTLSSSFSSIGFTHIFPLVMRTVSREKQGQMFEAWTKMQRGRKTIAIFDARHPFEDSKKSNISDRSSLVRSSEFNSFLLLFFLSFPSNEHRYLDVELRVNRAWLLEREARGRIANERSFHDRLMRVNMLL